MNKKINKWLNKIVEKGIPSDVKAIYINLVECSDDVDLEFYGIGVYEIEDQDWACNDIFDTDSLELEGVLQSPDKWEVLLHQIAQVVKGYIEIKYVQLSEVKRVGVGFGDSETIILKDEI